MVFHLLLKQMKQKPKMSNFFCVNHLPVILLVLFTSSQSRDFVVPKSFRACKTLKLTCTRYLA